MTMHDENDYDNGGEMDQRFRQQRQRYRYPSSDYVNVEQQQYYDVDAQQRQQHGQYYPSSSTHQQEFQYHREATSTTNGRPMRWFEPNFAIAVAIIVVLIHRFYVPILRWIDAHRDVSVRDSVCDLYVTVVDYVRAYCLMGCESVKSTFGTFSSFVTGTGNNGQGGGGWVIVRRIRQAVVDVGRAASGKMASHNLAMPELEPVIESQEHINSGSNDSLLLRQQQRNGHKQRRNRHDQQPGQSSTNYSEEEDELRSDGSLTVLRRSTKLEPAFLNEAEYPPGWMVYHPFLGVVPKTTADKYDAQQRQQRQVRPSTKSCSTSAHPKEGTSSERTNSKYRDSRVNIGDENQQNSRNMNPFSGVSSERAVGAATMHTRDPTHPESVMSNRTAPAMGRGSSANDPPSRSRGSRCETQALNSGSNKHRETITKGMKASAADNRCNVDGGSPSDSINPADSDSSELEGEEEDDAPHSGDNNILRLRSIAAGG